MNIKNYTSSVPFEKSVLKIEKMLVSAGAPELKADELNVEIK